MAKQKTRKVRIGDVYIIVSSESKKGGTRKYNRNRAKCHRYRNLVGKPRGRGIEGNKSGRNS